jgi:hypothetical protein
MIENSVLMTVKKRRDVCVAVRLRRPWEYKSQRRFWAKKKMSGGARIVRRERLKVFRS